MKTLSSHLKKRSKEICRANGCKADNHNCESYAYINAKGELLDICTSVFFPFSSEPFAAILLPWRGSQSELMVLVKDETDDVAAAQKLYSETMEEPDSAGIRAAWELYEESLAAARERANGRNARR